MSKNIALAKFIFSLHFAWFWLGIWIPYYLLFTNYAGIGIIETLVVASAFLLELPTGALADLIGKKKTLFIAFVCFTIGDVIMAQASNFFHLLLSVTILGIGTSFYSGTRDAFLYDSLKSTKKEDVYSSVLASIQKWGLVIMASASLIGGWLYTINPSLPFWLVAGAHGICGLLVLLLTEPTIDSEKFNLKTYVKHIKIGTYQLFAKQNNINWILKIFIVGALTKYLIEGMDPALAIEYGLNELQLGYIYAAIPLISAAGAHMYEKYVDKKSQSFWWKAILFAIFVPSLFAPFLGLTFGIMFLLFRNIFYPILEIIGSATVNTNVESKYRATALSAYNMIQSMPYVLGAALAGYIIDKTSVGYVVSALGIVFAIMYITIHWRQLYATKS